MPLIVVLDAGTAALAEYAGRTMRARHARTACERLEGGRAAGLGSVVKMTCPPGLQCVGQGQVNDARENKKQTQQWHNGRATKAHRLAQGTID